MNQIAEYRKAKGYTQQQLADICSIRRETVAKLEKDVYNCSLGIADALAYALDATIYDIFPELTSRAAIVAQIEAEKDKTRNSVLNNVAKLSAAMLDNS